MVGLHILKHRFNRSDDEVVKELHENLYWMVFCGVEGHLGTDRWEEYLDESTMTNFRKRIGPTGMAVIEAVLKDQLLQQKQINPRRQLVDTTVQEKHIAYPRDTYLLARGRKLLVNTVEQLKKLGAGINLYSFADQAKRIVVFINKLGRNKTEQVKEKTKELAEIVGKVAAQIPEQLQEVADGFSERVRKRIQQLQEQLQHQKELVKKVIAQTQARLLHGIHLPNKVLSLHEPEAVAIAKGKHNKPYEYGSKVSLSVDENGYVVGHQEYADNRADLDTLDAAVQQWEQACGRKPKELAGDRGFHNPKPSETVSQIERVAIPTKGKTPHPDSKQRYFKRLQRKRAGMEAVIGHLKSDHRMNRCRYKGFNGDKINVTLAVLAWNTKKWVRKVKEQEKKAG
jgi:IS5 family transposase